MRRFVLALVVLGLAGCGTGQSDEEKAVAVCGAAGVATLTTQDSNEYQVTCNSDGNGVTTPASTGEFGP